MCPMQMYAAWMCTRAFPLLLCSWRQGRYVQGNPHPRFRGKQSQAASDSRRDRSITTWTP